MGVIFILVCLRHSVVALSLLDVLYVCIHNLFCLNMAHLM